MSEQAREPNSAETDEDILDAISDGASLLEQLSQENIDLSVLKKPARAESHASSQHSSKSIIISHTVVTPEQSDAEDEEDVDDEAVVCNKNAPASTTVELVYGDQRNQFSVGPRGISRDDILKSFRLPKDSNMELQDEAEQHVAIADVQAGSSLNLIVRRSRRTNRPGRQAAARQTNLRLSAGLEYVQSRLLDESFHQLDQPRNSDPAALAEFNAVWDALRADLAPDVGPQRSSSFNDALSKPGDRLSRASTVSGTLAMRELKLKLQSSSQQSKEQVDDHDSIHVDYEPSTTVVLTPTSQRHIGLTLKRLHIHHVEQKTVDVSEGELPQHITRLHFLNTNVRLSSGAGTRLSNEMDYRIFVASLDKDSEAVELGIKSGDLLVSINGRSVLDLTVEDVESLIQFSTGKLILEICHLQAQHADLSATLEQDPDATIEAEPRESDDKLQAILGDELQRVTALNLEMKRSGVLVVKPVLEAGGAKKKKRQWKEYFVTLRGHMLYLFSAKDKMDSDLTASPSGGRISIKSCICDIAHSYRKHEHVFKVQAFNGSEYLMRGADHKDMLGWIADIQENSNPDHDFSPRHDLIKRKASEVSSRGTSSTSLSPAVKPRSREGSRTQFDNVKPRGFLGRVRSRKKMEADSGTDANVSIFDMPLESACSQHGTPVPIHLQRLVEEIERRALDEEGLYRLPGARSTLDRLKQALIDDPVKADLGAEAFADVHALSGIVKDYIRNLPEPLLTAEAYPPLMQAMASPSEVERLESIKAVLLQLPAVNVRTLDFILTHLQTVVSHKDVNKMQVTNVALIFGPTMIRPAVETPMTMLSDMAAKNKLMELLITHRKRLLYQTDHEASDMHLLESQQSTDTVTTAPSSSSASHHTDDDRHGYIDVQVEQDEAIAAAAALPTPTPVGKRPSYTSALALSQDDKASMLRDSPLTRFEVHVASTPTQAYDASASFSGRSTATSEHTAQGERSRSNSQPSAMDTGRLQAFSKAPPRYPSPLTTGTLRHGVAGSNDSLGDGSGIQRSHRPPSYSKITRLGTDGAVTVPVDGEVDVDQLASPIFVDGPVEVTSQTPASGGVSLDASHADSSLANSQGEAGAPASPGRIRRLKVNLKGLSRESTL
eukprot:m.122471 g.122471  ORF g.122471 m.122471 type:complete len:1120 (+) comp15653_c0_seq2:141-3500(+)